MWVEMRLIVKNLSVKARSSSSWGCELKWFGDKFGKARKAVILFVRMWVEMYIRCCFRVYLRHPLREDVSWNSIATERVSGIKVILFVRMWVEIPYQLHLCNTFWSSSSWGCELKYWNSKSGRKPFVSSSSWGCELKYVWSIISWDRRQCHPLREDVSWNVSYGRYFLCENCHPLREDVSWNL